MKVSDPFEAVLVLAITKDSSSILPRRETLADYGYRHFSKTPRKCEVDNSSKSVNQRERGNNGYNYHTFDKSFMISETRASCVGRASIVPVRAHSADIASELLPVPLL